MKCVLALALVLLLDASRSEAGFQATVRFTGAGGIDKSVVIDGDYSAIAAGGGDLLGTATYMGYKVNVSGYTTQSASMSLLSQTTTEVVRTSAATTVLTVQVTTYDDTFTAPSSGTPVRLANEFTGTNFTAGTKSNPKVATASGFLAGADGTGEVDTFGQVFVGIGTFPYRADTVSVLTAIPSSPFKMGNVLTITGLSQVGDAATLTATTSVVAVPVPPAYALLLSALPASGLYYLRRRKQE